MSKLSNIDKKIAFSFLKFIDYIKLNQKTTDESLDIANDCLK